MKQNIGVIGGGSWGTALARLLANKGFNTSMWIRDKIQVQAINDNKINSKYLPDILLPNNLYITDDLEKTIAGKEILILSVPTHSIRDILTKSKDLIKKDQIIVNVAKGIENDTLLRVSEIVNEILPDNNYAILSGPSHAEEVAIDVPTAVISASKDKRIAEYIQDIFTTPKFRVYTNPDVIGVELGGALKNIIALGAGISDGQKYGDNTKAALMTRGIMEMARLGTKLGANPLTFSGLSGIGDLIVTCTSLHSRNRRAGILLGQGMTLDEAVKNIGMVVEGVKTTKSAYKLAEFHNIEMPITEEIYNVLYKNISVDEAVMRLMGREKKHEIEEIVSYTNIKW